MSLLPNRTRMQQMQTWLDALITSFALDSSTLIPASTDASFRRYFRITTQDPAHPTLIVMDAPPEHEDCKAFIDVAQLFSQAGLSVPQILAQNIQQGFLLVSDLGQTTYLSAINESNADGLMHDATRALVQLQQASRPDVLALYDRPVLLGELNLFPQWYVERHLGHTLNNDTQQALHHIFEILLTNNLAQPLVYVHRDYHARNLMVLRDGNAVRNPGILDFQDAVFGPITYDLVSLLRDAYIHWPEERVLDWGIRYWVQARRVGLPVAADYGDFWRDFEWMGLQRHLKILGIFARLSHRDGKNTYLNDIPLVLRYIREVARRYGVFRPLLQLLDTLENQTLTAAYTF